jgi:hypothetical protein
MWPQKFTPRHEARGNGMNKKPLIERNLYIGLSLKTTNY